MVRRDAVLNHMRIKSTWQAARDAGKTVLAEVARQNYDEQSSFSIRLAMEEGLNNAIRHGSKMDPAAIISLDYEVTPQRVEIIITDDGEGFDPECVPDCTCQENLEKPGGRGIMLMKAFMDTVEYSEKGNRVRLVKVRPGEE